eukprot:COSAG03_NODE_26224_length_260_cov_1.124224_1_plen_68_part_01
MILRVVCSELRAREVVCFSRQMGSCTQRTTGAISANRWLKIDGRTIRPLLSDTRRLPRVGANQQYRPQ